MEVNEATISDLQLAAGSGCQKTDSDSQSFHYIFKDFTVIPASLVSC